MRNIWYLISVYFPRAEHGSSFFFLALCVLNPVPFSVWFGCLPYVISCVSILCSLVSVGGVAQCLQSWSRDLQRWALALDFCGVLCCSWFWGLITMSSFHWNSWTFSGQGALAVCVSSTAHHPLVPLTAADHARPALAFSYDADALPVHRAPPELSRLPR
jgi:hypothetical protein